MFKKTMFMILTMAMLLPLMPAFTVSVFAESEDIGNMNALDALGIDTSIMPEGYDENSQNNPYGRNSVTVNPVYELFLTGVNKTSGPVTNTEDIMANEVKVGEKTTVTNTFNLQNTLYGNNQALKQTMDNFYDTQGVANNRIVTEKIITETLSTPTSTSTSTSTIIEPIDKVLAATSSTSGNFIGGNSAGKTGQIVTVGADSLSKNGGLYLYFSDPLTGSVSGMKTLLDTNAIIGNSGNQMEENFVESPYLMQNYLKITTGDFDNNGIDEVAVYVAEQGKSRVEIYKLETTSSPALDFYLTESNWKKAWTYYFNETPYVSNMVSLTAGDFNRDGTDDIALTWGYYYGADKNNGGQAVVLYGSNVNMLQIKKTINLSYNTANIVRAAFAYGDIDGDNVNDLILGGQLASDIAGGNLNTRFIGVYTYDGTNDNFLQSVAKNFDLFEKKDGSYVNAVMATHNNKYYSSPASIANIATVNMNGVGRAAYIYLDSLLYEYGENGLVINMALDQNGSFNKNMGNIQKYYVEYGIVAADFTGDAKETLQVMQYYTPVVNTITIPVYHYFWWWYRYTEYTIEVPIPGNLNMMGIYGNSTGILVKRTENIDFSNSYCKLNTDQDTALLKYTAKPGSHYVTYSDPKVLAVLASAPYFADLDNDELSGSYMESGTSYTSSSGSGSGGSISHTLNIGAYVSFEHDFEVFGVKVASVQAEASYNHGWTWETANSSMLEQSISYSTIVGSDAVAFYAIPIETYVYESIVPIFNKDTGVVTGYDTQYMSVNIPHTASVKVLPLETYEKIAADYSELPQVSGTILTHTVGKPSTYPSSTSGFSNAIQYSGDWSGLNYGGGSVTQEITMTSETEKSYTNTNSVEAKVGAGPGNFVFGVSAGYEHGSSEVTVTTAGSSFSGQLFNMPTEAEPYHYGYSWKIFSYQYSDGGSSFPVVSYLVTDVTAPPRLPTDFQQDIAGTTDERITLTWSYIGSAAGFQIYRYYLFPDGGGSYELAFVPASDSVGADVNSGTRYYQYIDTGLDPYTDYDYQIQVIGASQPTDSILSAVYAAKTKINIGYPNISLSGATGGKLLVYPDTNTAVNVIINNMSDYTQTPRYQWQKLTDAGWTNISGATDTNYIFKSAGIADEGMYRCRVNAIYSSYYISAYSDVFTMEYSKRIPVVVEGSFTVTDVVKDGITLPKIAISLKSAHVNHNYYPLGNITFIVTGSDYSRSYPVVLIAQASGEAYASITLDSLLPNGAYEITAYYSGSRVYKSLTTENAIAYLSGSGNGYVLTFNSKYIYGDNIVPSLKSVQKTDGITSTSLIEDAISYKIIKYDWEWKLVHIFHGYYWQKQLVPSEISSFISGNSVTAAMAGNFTLVASVGGVEVASKEFIVAQREVTIGITNQDGVAGNPSLNHPNSSILTVHSGTLAYGETIDNLGLAVKATNTAGTIEVINKDTNPGYYTIVGIPGVTLGTKYDNYFIRYITGTYILTGPKYSVAGVSKELNSKTVGTIEVVTPENNDNWNTLYANGTTLVFLAKPHIGYDVKRWTIIKADTGDIIATGISSLTQSHYMMSEDIIVTVEFEVAQRTLTYQAIESMGKVECTNSTVIQSGGVAKSGAEFVFRATPAKGYHFVEWQLTEIGKSPTNPIGTSHTDGSNTSEITMGNGNTAIYAIFARDNYILTLQGELQASYLDDTDNNITTPDQLVIAISGNRIKGDKIVTVTNKPGFSIGSDAVWTKDGISVITGVSSDNKSYTFTMLDNTFIASETKNERYGVTMQVKGPGNTVNTVSIAVNGKTSIDLSDIAGGSSLVFTAASAYGYVFDKWIINGKDDTSSGRIFNIAVLGGELNVEAVFKDNTAYTISVTYGLRGSLSYTLNGGEGKVIASGGQIPVFKGDSVVLTATPKINFMVENWMIDKVVNQTTIKTQTFADIAANISVETVFGAQSYSTVTYEADTYGEISTAKSDGVSFESGSNSIGNGSTLQFVAAPSTGKMVKEWKLNGTVVKNNFGETLVDTTFTITALSGSANVEVSFKDIITHIVTSELTKATITSQYLPEFESGVRDGATAIFTVKPDENHRISSVTIGITGEEELSEFDSITKNADGTWVCVMNAVTNDLTIMAEAKEIYSITTPTTPTGGSITLSADKAMKGDVIIITATPTSKMYKFTNWVVTGDGITLSDSLATTTTFIMPMSSVTVAATFTYIGNDGGANIGNSGGSISSVGDTVITPTPTPTSAPTVSQSDRGNAITATISLNTNTDVNTGTVSAKVDADTLKSLVSTIIGESKPKAIAEIKLDASADSKAADIEISREAFNNLANTGNIELRIDTGIGTLQFDEKTLKTISESSGQGDISISITTVDTSTLMKKMQKEIGDRPVFDFSVKIGDTTQVSEFGGGSAQISIPYTLKTGENKNSVIVYYIDNKGNLKTVRGKYDSGSGMVNFTTSHFSQYAVGYNEVNFNDVEETAWYKESVDFIAARGITTGTGNGNYSPEDKLTRGQYIVMMLRAYGIDPDKRTADNFADVGNTYYTGYIATVKRMGISDGIGNNMFAPDKEITRQEMFTLLYNTLKLIGELPEETVGKKLTAFRDAGRIAPWAKDAVTLFVNTGVITGSGYKLAPTDTTNRAQMAQVLYNLLSR